MRQETGAWKRWIWEADACRLLVVGLFSRRRRTPWTMADYATPPGLDSSAAVALRIQDLCLHLPLASRRSDRSARSCGLVLVLSESVDHMAHGCSQPVSMDENAVYGSYYSTTSQTPPWAWSMCALPQSISVNHRKWQW